MKSHFFLAVRRGSVDDVRRFLKEGVDVNSREGLGETALMAAACRGHADVVRLLLEAGAKVNADDDYYRTALSFAAEHGHPEVARLLLDAGANFNALDVDAQESVCAMLPGRVKPNCKKI